MEEDLKDIELFIDFCKAPYNFEHESEARSYEELSNKIEHLIKAYKEREEEMNKINQQLDLDYVDKNFIPVSLVEEKIEEYKKKIDIAQGEELLILDSNKTIWRCSNYTYSCECHTLTKNVKVRR